MTFDIKRSSFYLYLASNDSDNLFPGNNFLNFIVQFPRMLQLSQSALDSAETSNGWTFAITDISISHQQSIIRDSGVVLLCDLAPPAYIKNTEARVIRTLPGLGDDAASVIQPFYLEACQTNFNKIHIKVVDRELHDIDAGIYHADTVLRCILHFQRA